MRRVFFAFVCLSSLHVSTIFAQQEAWIESKDSLTSQSLDNIQADTVYQNFIADIVLEKAKEYLGVRYSMGGMSHNGMDCSGLICTSFSVIDYNLPHSSGQLAKMGTFVEAEDLMPGDLIFFQNRNKTGIGHVAMVSKIENESIYIIHATTGRGVMEEILQNNSYFMPRWVYNKRIIE